MIRAQDWPSLPVASLDKFTPSLPVTVVVPCRDGGDGVGANKLALVLASLACQDYPSELLSVIVVDDGSPVPLSLPSLRPQSTSLLRLEDEGPLWGKARAFNEALALVSTPLVMSLDADMLLHPSHVRAASRWPHLDGACVVLGYKRMVTQWQSDPAEVCALLTSGDFDSCASGPGEPHGWFEEEVERTAQFTTHSSEVFKAFVGATVMLRTDLLRKAGGYDVQMRLAEDTELGYRLYAAGAVFVPEKQALSWHLGLTTMDQHRETILAHNHALLAPRVPAISYLRRGRSAVAYPVAHAVVNIPVLGEPSAARALAEQLLSGALGIDVHVNLVAHFPDSGRYSPRSDEFSELRALRDALSCDPRVSFSASALESVFPATYLVDAHPLASAKSLRTLLGRLRDDELGVVAVAGNGLDHGQVCIWRTAALSRVLLEDGSLPIDRLARIRRVGQAWGEWWMAASTARLMMPKVVSDSFRVPLSRRAAARLRKAMKWRLSKLASKL